MAPRNVFTFALCCALAALPRAQAASTSTSTVPATPLSMAPGDTASSALPTRNDELAPTTASATVVAPMLRRLQRQAPSLDAGVLSMALEARDCATRRGLVSPTQRLAVIDYSLPSTQRRLWVFDLQQPRLLFDEYVAHGRGSGDNVPTRFSNDDGSHSSSLGLFSTAETYIGGNGYSLRMDGLEPGYNDHARDRAIVMHGAWYVDPGLAGRMGRLGRSYGCPALRPTVAHQVIDSLKGGQLLFAYYPDRNWLQHSSMLRCQPGTTVAAIQHAR